MKTEIKIIKFKMKLTNKTKENQAKEKSIKKKTKNVKIKNKCERESESRK